MKNLPPGQKAYDIFPRFGLPQYANRFPKQIDKILLSIGGDVGEFKISSELDQLSRIDQVSDFHCVTGWSKLSLNWSGYRFLDFYNTFIAPKAKSDIKFVVLKAQDGFKTSLALSDLIQSNVLLADRLDHQSLSISHGAPLRIIAPAHYGYKNVKHINRLEFYAERQEIKQGFSKFIDHPRARVDHEERALRGPGILYRWLYKFGIKGTIRTFKNALDSYEATSDHKPINKY